MNISKKNLTPIALVSIFLLMLGLSFAAVPLYDLFCRVTGFGGTTQNATDKEIPKIIVNQDYKMRFDTNINSTLDWKFYPEMNTLNLKPGEVHTVKFKVENPSNEISSGSATFNVSPSPFGIYLNKIGCFCFEKQTLQPGEKKEFVLTFFLDPKVVDDNKTKKVYYFHSKALWLLLIGFALVIYGAFMWWRDVIEEAEHQGHHTPVVQIGHRYGMTLFIASEVMFFVAWFWAFFNASLFPPDSIGGIWPPADIKTFDPWDIPLINTLILLLSGTTVTWAHHAMLENDRKGLVNGLIATVFLGFIFSCFQAYEYHHATFTLDGGIYGSTFYMSTGFHGFHVIVGTVFLAVCLFRSMRGHSTPQHHFGFEAAAWYWHFVDVVWLFLFAAIYIWGS